MGSRQASGVKLAENGIVIYVRIFSFLEIDGYQKNPIL